MIGIVGENWSTNGQRHLGCRNSEIRMNSAYYLLLQRWTRRINQRRASSSPLFKYLDFVQRYSSSRGIVVRNRVARPVYVLYIYTYTYTYTLHRYIQIYINIYIIVYRISIILAYGIHERTGLDYSILCPCGSSDVPDMGRRKPKLIHSLLLNFSSILSFLSISLYGICAYNICIYVYIQLNRYIMVFIQYIYIHMDDIHTLPHCHIATVHLHYVYMYIYIYNTLIAVNFILG